MNMALRTERPEDYRTVENLTREAFWNVYRPGGGCDEHYLLHLLRTDPAYLPELHYVAELDGQLVGSIVYSRSTVAAADGTQREIVTFGPISVLPTYQKQGIGSQLIRHTMPLAREMGFGGVVIFGNPAYYHRFGFVNAADFGIQTGDGQNFDAFMAAELYPGGLNGVTGRFHEAAAFTKLTDEALEAYDRDFPPKIKEITATQLHF